MNFARCESRLNYRELVVAFRSKMKGHGKKARGGAGKQSQQRGMLMLERGREQRKGRDEFEKKKRENFVKASGTVSADQLSRRITDRNAKAKSFLPSMPCSWQPERCREIQIALKMPKWYQKMCTVEAAVASEEEKLAAEALRVELLLLDAQKSTEDEQLKLIEMKKRWELIEFNMTQHREKMKQQSSSTQHHQQHQQRHQVLPPVRVKRKLSSSHSVVDNAGVHSDEILATTGATVMVVGGDDDEQDRRNGGKASGSDDVVGPLLLASVRHPSRSKLGLTVTVPEDFDSRGGDIAGMSLFSSPAGIYDLLF